MGCDTVSLKPSKLCRPYGTAEAVPCYKPILKHTLRTRGAKSFGAAGRIVQFAFHNLMGKKGMLQQFGDLVAFADGIRLVAQVFHEHNDFAAITGVNDY